MINWRLISKVLGGLLFIEAGLMVLCQIVSFLYDEGVIAFAPAIGVALLLGTVLMLVGRNAGTNMGRKDGYIVVSTVWILFSIIGMIPFLTSDSVADVSSAFFETMSGFTSTGATILDDIDSMQRGILFWRSVTQWVGGIGIIFFTIAILPAFGVGEVKLFAAESTGPLHDKVHPRISVAVKWIGSVYIMLTILCFCSLMICGMDVFDSINYSFCTTGTGGYGTHSDLLHDVYHSPLIEYVLSFFMLISGINYTLIYYSILKGRFRSFFSDAEVRCFLIIAGVGTLLCTLVMTIAGTNAVGTVFASDDMVKWIFDISPALASFELSFRESLFTIISLQTTTGLATCDYTLWPVQLMPILLFVMFAGACSGSTSGGFKCVRLSIIYRVLRNEFTHILHPRAVMPVRLNGAVIEPTIVQTLLGFITLFVIGLFAGAFVLALFGVDPNDVHPNFDYYEAFGIAMSSISNVGPGMGYYGPAHSWAILNPYAKYVCSFLMLIGRLEIFPIVILLTRNFWRK